MTIRITQPLYQHHLDTLHANERMLIREQEQLIRRERRLLTKPFISERTVEIMYETLAVLFT